ncbi:hypothetical protein F5Y17DRAFT_478036 [Xylariaceae sp. FL0594]|nr:hypothetical protein F5Y17DRAFT_478036 [Xylariaceae sp. FL0594]
MDSYMTGRGLHVGLGRRLSRLYDDAKKSSDFVQETSQTADDPEIKALHRKLRIQKDRFVSWGLEWSDSSQSAEIDESLNEAGLTNIVMSIMGTIKDILAEAEPLWLASKRPAGGDRPSEKSPGDRKIVWDKNRFEDLVKDLTTSVDTLCDLSRTRSSVALAAGPSTTSRQPKQSVEDMRPYGSTRIRTPQQIKPETLTSIRSMQALPLSETEPLQSRPQEVCFMSKEAYADLTHRPAGQPWSPLLVEYAEFDPIYTATGIMPEMSRFERLSAGLQSESSRQPGAWIGLPLLLGYYEDMPRSRLALVYSFPPTFQAVTFESGTQRPIDNLCTLTNLLSRPDYEPTLEAKFRLAYNLANTVFDMHSRGITHGNLNGSTISFANSGGRGPGGSGRSDVDIRHPLVSSFDIFPKPSSASRPPSSLLYRHPLDPQTMGQSPLVPTSDSRTLDLYSLAMMLISIGLWTALENLVPSPDAPGVPESVLGQLAIRCGTPYMRAVQACWNAVDLGLSRPGTIDEIIRQIQTKVGGYLEACCILDGVSGLEDRLGDNLQHSPYSQRSARTAHAATRPGPSFVTEKSLDADVKSVAPPDASSSLPADRKPKVELTSADSKSENHNDKPRVKSKLRLYPQIPLPNEIVQQWNEILMPQINLALKHFYRKNPESVEISLESIGESPQRATPTVLVVCTSVSKVRAILMKKLGILFDGTTTDISLKVCRGSVVRSRKGPIRKKGESGKTASLRQYRGNEGADEQDEQETTAANPDYQERPQNGASIGAWIGNKHLPPVSLGGVIIVDDKPYGMTVHHMLDDPDCPYQAPGDLGASLEYAPRANAPVLLRSSAAAAHAMSHLNAGETGSESSGEDFTCEFSDTESQYSATDLTSDDEDDEEEEGVDEPGDIPGIEPGWGDGYIVTQPALDDVPAGFYPSSETEDEDHLDTYKVGDVYASSGIRRRTENNVVHEIDWALFEFQNDRIPGGNVFPLAAGITDSRTPGPLQPVEVAPAKSLPGLDVQCMARTSGCQAGRILPTMASVKIYGRTSPSHSYQVSGKIPGLPRPALARNQGARDARLGIPGDSGAWIVDVMYGRLCGHILAWSERKQVAYICPMDVLLLDIAETLEATEVRLPNGVAIVTLAGAGEEDRSLAAAAPGSEGWVGEQMAESDDIPQLVRSYGNIGYDDDDDNEEGLEHVTAEDINQAQKLSSAENGAYFPSRMRTLARNMDKVQLQ